jgi:hypothetical protein
MVNDETRKLACALNTGGGVNKNSVIKKLCSKQEKSKLE